MGDVIVTLAALAPSCISIASAAYLRLHEKGGWWVFLIVALIVIPSVKVIRP